MGLPGAGKTYLAQGVLERLEFAGRNVMWANANEVRKHFNDWDFSVEGRIRLSLRMRQIADALTNADYVICDFVCPLPEMRENFDADYTIWVDTIKESKDNDTNQMFIPPAIGEYDFRIREQDAIKHSETIVNKILDDENKIN